jgi:hypothetical protein
MNIYLNNEEQKCKTVLVGGEYLWERVKKGKYGLCILYTSMKTEL